MRINIASFETNFIKNVTRQSYKMQRRRALKVPAIGFSDSYTISALNPACNKRVQRGFKSLYSPVFTVHFPL